MIHSDVAIIGGGPAGACCAAKLAELGFTVSCFEKGEARRQHVGESLPSSARVLFESLALELPADVLVRRPPEHRVYWGRLAGATDHRSDARESSFLVWRGPFDERLRAAATSKGATLIPSPVHRVKRRATGHELTCGDGATFHCRFLVDASGRAGTVARRYRRRERGFRTLALTAHFRTDELAPPTIVESFPDGWVWSAPLRDGLRDVTLMLDERADYHDTLRRAEHVYAVVADASQVGPVRGIDTTPYSASRFCGDDVLLVGDAGSFLDPLAAHGVHKAVDGALVAAVVVRTILERPRAAADAAAFFHEREATIYKVTTERLRRIYRQETRFSGRPFWRKRAGAERATTPGPPRPPLRPEMKLRPAPGVELFEAPVLEGGFIERRKVLTAPGKERAVRFFRNVSLPEIFTAVIGAESAASAARAAELSFDEAYAAIDWLYHAGYLIEWRA